MGWGYGDRFPRYVTKAEKIRKAEKARTALIKKGGAIEPVIIIGSKIACTWWGQAWNRNLERYADYSNRLPRGRSYLRNGSVLDLKLGANGITALVAGSRPKPYQVSIKVKPLNKAIEQALMEKSRASLDSMQSLLSGEFPADLKESFFAEKTGLFPSPKEIEFSCSCPDWASMCKHVAAALYGTAARMDEKPELFFVLRGINIGDFVGKLVKRESAKMLKKAKVKSNRVIEGEDADISKMFGIAMDDGKPAHKQNTPAVALPAEKGTVAVPRKPRKPARRSPAGKPRRSILSVQVAR